MRCSKCGAENPNNKRFCGDCSAMLANRCSKCGADNALGKRFCADCGAPLSVNKQREGQSGISGTAGIRITSEQPDSLAAEGERKTVTALFADITGSTELEQDLDPEEARAIIDPALKIMIDAARRYDGYVQSTGDGIFALFGAPAAHEDHPQRALHAALRMQQEIRRYGDRLLQGGGVPIEIRVGVNTGEVVVRPLKTGDSHSEYTPIGHTMNLASRMQTVARSGSVVVSEATRKLVEGYFQLKSIGPAKVKGVSGPVQIYEVTGLGPLRTRLQRAATRGYTKFVGRAREMEALTHAAELAKQGHGRIVAAVADPGVGKSRLFYEFEVKNQTGWMVLEAVSFSHGKATAYLPIIDMFHSYFAIDPGDDPRKRREKVIGKLLGLDRSLEDALPYVFGLLGLTEGQDPLARMDAQVRRRRTLDHIKRILLRESLDRPLMVVFEDLHWIDEETQEFLNLLAEAIARAPVLMLVNYWPEYTHQWGSKTYYTQLRLDPLGKESAGEMLDELLGVNEQTSDNQLTALKRMIIEKTEGTPLFMEEIYQSLIEEGALVRNGAVKLTRPLNTLKMPATVQAILQSRIDRLPAAEKELLQTLAVIGMEFPLALVREVTKKPDDELNRMLNDLQLADFIYEQPAVGDIEYTFKHALTREVAYNSLLNQRKKLLHEQIGSAIEAAFTKSIDDHLSELAYHYGQSGDRDKAVDYLTRAGTQTSQRAAYPEAMQHFRKALELLQEMPPGRSRDARELMLRAAIGTVAFVSEGEGSDEAGEELAHMFELASALDDVPMKIRALASLAAHYLARGELRRASEISHDLYRLSAEMPNPEFRAPADHVTGFVALSAGEFRKAEQHLGAAAAAEDPAIRGHALITKGLALWYLGFPDQALARTREGLMLSDYSEPYAYAASLFWAVTTYLQCGDLAVAEDLSRKAFNLCTERGFPAIAALHTVQMGLLTALRGRSETGLEQIRSGLKSLGRAVPVLKRGPFVLALGYELAGKPDEAFATLEQAVKEFERNDIGPEMHLLKGRLLEVRSNREEAENSFRTAIEISRKQSAKSLELRATTSLARLLDRAGYRDEARAMLREIYEWFTEGFDTSDLKHAKALLQELNN